LKKPSEEGFFFDMDEKIKAFVGIYFMALTSIDCKT
jgi:hypothetical protein